METWLLEQLAKESSVIKGAPFIFVVTWLIAGTLIWWILDRYVYRSRLEAKDDLIRTYREKLGLVPESGAPPISSKAKKIKGLGDLIQEGQQIRFRCPWPCSAEREKPWMEEWNVWINKVEKFLKEETGPKALTKFRHVAGIEESQGIGYPTSSLCPLFDRQIQNLVDIMERIDLYV